MFARRCYPWGVVQSTDPVISSGAKLAFFKNLVVCNCGNQPPEQTAKELSTYLSLLQKSKEKNPKSSLLSQEIGLTYIRLSLIERKLGHQSQEGEYMRSGQSELVGLGWKDVSDAHLYLLVSQLNSEYHRPDTVQRNALAASISN
jgi:hypothetical protein